MSNLIEDIDRLQIKDDLFKEIDYCVTGTLDHKVRYDY